MDYSMIFIRCYYKISIDWIAIIQEFCKLLIETYRNNYEILKILNFKSEQFHFISFQDVYLVLCKFNWINIEERTSNTNNCFRQHGLVSFRLLVTLVLLFDLKSSWRQLLTIQTQFTLSKIVVITLLRTLSFRQNFLLYDFY